MGRAVKVTTATRDRSCCPMARARTVGITKGRSRTGEDVVQTHASHDKSLYKMDHAKHAHLTLLLQILVKVVKPQHVIIANEYQKVEIAKCVLIIMNPIPLMLLSADLKSVTQMRR